MGSFLLKLQTLPTIYYISVHVGDKRVCNHNWTEHDISITYDILWVLHCHYTFAVTPVYTVELLT